MEGQCAMFQEKIRFNATGFRYLVRIELIMITFIHYLLQWVMQYSLLMGNGIVDHVWFVTSALIAIGGNHEESL